MEPKPISDELLMQEIKVGNMLAFDELYRRYFDRIYRFAVSLVKLPEEAENIVQDVFLKLWVNRDKVEKGSSVRYYVFTITYHASISAIRKRIKETNYLHELFHHIETDRDDSSLQMEYAELESKLAAILEKLPDRQREVYLLHRTEGLKYSEIAGRLGLSVNTVENHMTRALRTIRENLEGYSLVALLFVSLFV